MNEGEAAVDFSRDQQMHPVKKFSFTIWWRHHALPFIVFGLPGDALKPYPDPISKGVRSSLLQPGTLGTRPLNLLMGDR